METIESVLKQLNDYKQLVRNTVKKLSEMSDGFKYIVIIHSYGSHSKREFNNLYLATELANEYYEDNGFANIYTNNKDAKSDPLSGGCIYYVEDISTVSAYNNPVGAIMLVESVNSAMMRDYYNYPTEEDFSQEDLMNESELNALENQSPEQ